MFVRAKKIKDSKYAYLVQNSWKGKKVSQKVKKYLGKIVFMDDEYLLNFKNVEEYDWNLPLKLLFREIISNEFICRGFIRKTWCLIKNDLQINLSTGKITQNGVSVVLFINGRYLYDKILLNIQNFYHKDSDDEIERGKTLAQLFSDAGINISKEVFIQLYKKINADE
ncbi:MAG: hypothetical protein PHU51_01460 [Candidatus Nanoarchaeia archaeon]|nr:hypothetical protein [Candidatus Nanoarchaeia archaeon]